MSEESKQWYRMTRPLFNSGFEDDEFWAYGQDGFQEVLDSFLGSDVEIYEKRLGVEPQHVRAIIQNVTSDSITGATLRQILCNIGTLRCGQYVKIDDAYWLVSAYADNNRIYEKAVLWKCKYTLRFLSPLTGEVVEYPVYDMNSTQYGTGEQEKEHITIGDSQHLVYIPYNEETILIDSRFRFLMDKNRLNPTAYRITQVDPISYSVGSECDDGLIQWSILETQFNAATDNAELMIADYYADEAGENTSEGSADKRLVLTDLDGDFMLTIGEEKQIRISCVDSSNEVTEAVSYEVAFEAEDGVAQMERDGDLLTIRAADDRENVGKTVFIRAYSKEIDSEAVMKIQITGW